MEPTQDIPQSKASMYSDYSDLSESDDMMKSSWDENRPFRRVRSPSRPRAWLSSSYKPKFGGKYDKYLSERDYHSVYQPGHSSSQRHQHPSPRPYMKMRDHYPPKSYHSAMRARETKWDKEEWERERGKGRDKEWEKERERGKEKEKEWEKDRGKEREKEWEKDRGKEREKEWEKDSGRYEKRNNSDGSSTPKQDNASRPLVPRSSSSRDKDTHIAICPDNRSHSREGDQRGSKSREREQSRDLELPLTASQRTARDRAIQQKRREIDEIYYQECEMFGLVTTMLIKKEPSLERLIQSSLQENLRDIGKRCVDAMEKFIEDYDSREPMH